MARFAKPSKPTYMKKNNALLHAFNPKSKKLIVGLMSGTSLDGLDIALCEFSGYGIKTKCRVRAFETVAYTNEVKKRIREVFAQPLVDFQKLSTLNVYIAQLHANHVLQTLKKWKVRTENITCLASHGQTVFHAPQSLFPHADYNSTLQIGDGDHLAVATGILTLSDFRQKHIAAGGEGAPLAAYGDYLLFTKKNENRILVNVGGIANFTFLPGNGKTKEVIVSDTGPGNTLLDQLVQATVKGDSFDKDGQYAASGIVNKKLLKALLNNPFFKQIFPKTTGPELFNLAYLKKAQQASATQHLHFYDVMATLTYFTAYTLCKQISSITKNKKCKVYLSGGGAHNPTLVDAIKKHLSGISVENVQKLGFNPDAKEAILFATLANETLGGHTISIGNVKPYTLGKISLPY
jgi:anhydro-N-acetylmuramic acid kinase